MTRLEKIFFFFLQFYFTFLLHGMWDLCSLSRDRTRVPVMGTCPLQWKHGVLTTGPPGSPRKTFFFFFLIELVSPSSNSCLPLLQGNRDENQNVNHQLAQEDAQRLYQAGEGRLGTDESCFNMILATRSFPQLKATMEAYSRV